MREQLATLFERLSAKEPARKILRRSGLDPDQFVLFLALFRTLSEQEELMSAVGVNRFSVSYLALCAAAFGVLPYTLAVCGSVPAPAYLFMNLAITLILFSIINIYINIIVININTNEIPKINYEVALDAMRVSGSDFFCGLTVPVNDSFCSLIVGGWGGGLGGVSGGGWSGGFWRRSHS